MTIAYLAIWLAGVATFAAPAEIAGLARTLGWTDTSPALVVVGFVLVKASAGIIIGVSSALGEEVGWRGFLAPRLAALTGFTSSALIVGAIWTVWHLPLLLFGRYNNGTEWWVAVGCFAVLVLSLSVILTGLRLRSNSVWPCAIFHASHNLFIQGVFTPLTGDRGSATPYFTGEFGIAVPAATAVLALWLWRRHAAGGPAVAAPPAQPA